MLGQVYSEKVKEFEVARHSLFFNDSGSRTIFKNHIKHIVMRRNTLNGRLYSEDPTVMAWGLLNEPRCERWLVRFGSYPITVGPTFDY